MWTQNAGRVFHQNLITQLLWLLGIFSFIVETLTLNPPKQLTTELVVNILCMDEGEEKDNYCLKALEPHFLLFPEMFQMT